MQVHFNSIYVMMVFTTEQQHCHQLCWQ